MFRVQKKPILLLPEKAQIVIMGLVYTYIISCGKALMTNKFIIDHEENGLLTRGTWRTEITTAITFTPLGVNLSLIHI